MTPPRDCGITGRAGELAALIPALASALTRDSAPAGGRPVLSAGCVVNMDVLHAMRMLHREIPAGCAAACELTGEPWHPRPLDVCLRALPRLHERLTHLDMVTAAARIERQCERWLRVTKLALGFRNPDRPLGFDCPLHEEPSPLIMIGSERFLRDGPVPSVTEPQLAGLIRCHLCGAEWRKLQWDFLLTMLASA